MISVSIKNSVLRDLVFKRHKLWGTKQHLSKNQAILIAEQTKQAWREWMAAQMICAENNEMKELLMFMQKDYTLGKVDRQGQSIKSEVQLQKEAEDRARSEERTKQWIPSVINHDKPKCRKCTIHADHFRRILPCQHQFCSPCMAEMVETFGKVECPLCNAIVMCDGVDEPFARANND